MKDMINGPATYPIFSKGESTPLPRVGPHRPAPHMGLPTYATEPLTMELLGALLAQIESIPYRRSDDAF